MMPSALARRWPSWPFRRRPHLRQALGLAVVVGGLALASQAGQRFLLGLAPPVSWALAGGLLAAAATGLGTLPVALSRTMSARVNSIMLGFGAGIMLSASVFSLILPALHATRARGSGAWEGGMLVGTGILLGASLLMILRHAFDATGHAKDRADLRSLHRAWFFVAAIVLHNIPEGVAIGVAFAGMDRAGAAGLTTGIAIQDIPEGLAVALALRAAGHGRWNAVAWGVASGLVEPLFAWLGAALVASFSLLLPWGLAGAAGAMLYVIAREVIPEAHREGAETPASAALMVGFVIMLLLDTALA